MAVDFLVDVMLGINPCVSLSVLVVILWISYTFIKNSKFPPGPTGLPYIGYGPFLGEYTTYFMVHFY